MRVFVMRLHIYVLFILVLKVEELHSNPTSSGMSHTLDQLADLTTAENSGELHAVELESITDSLDIVADMSDSDLLITDEQSQVCFTKLSLLISYI